MKQLKPKVSLAVVFSLGLILPLLFVLYMAGTLLSRHSETGNIWVTLLLLLSVVLTGPLFFISAGYLYEDLTKKVYLDPEKRQLLILILKRGKKLIITGQDVVESYRVSISSLRYRSYFFLKYSYILIVLKERKRVIITSLLCEPVHIERMLNLESNILEYYIPRIDRKLGEGILTASEFEVRVLEFEHNFLNHTESELKSIIRQKAVYTDYAREAASRLIHEKFKA